MNLNIQAMIDQKISQGARRQEAGVLSKFRFQISDFRLQTSEADYLDPPNRGLTTSSKEDYCLLLTDILGCCLTSTTGFLLKVKSPSTQSTKIVSPALKEFSKILVAMGLRNSR
jgi:hypothetical protein